MEMTMAKYEKYPLGPTADVTSEWYSSRYWDTGTHRNVLAGKSANLSNL